MGPEDSILKEPTENNRQEVKITVYILGYLEYNREYKLTHDKES